MLRNKDSPQGTGNSNKRVAAHHQLRTLKRQLVSQGGAAGRNHGVPSGLKTSTLSWSWCIIYVSIKCVSSLFKTRQVPAQSPSCAPWPLHREKLFLSWSSICVDLEHIWKRGHGTHSELPFNLSLKWSNHLTPAPVPIPKCPPRSSFKTQGVLPEGPLPHLYHASPPYLCCTRFWIHYHDAWKELKTAFLSYICPHKQAVNLKRGTSLLCMWEETEYIIHLNFRLAGVVGADSHEKDEGEKNPVSKGQWSMESCCMKTWAT